MKTITTLLATAFAAVAFSACGDQCVILANGGNKLCGDDAKAWCDSTDSLRNAMDDPALDEFTDPSIDSSLDESQSVCDEIRGTSTDTDF